MMKRKKLFPLVLAITLLIVITPTVQVHAIHTNPSFIYCLSISSAPILFIIIVVLAVVISLVITYVQHWHRYLDTKHNLENLNLEKEQRTRELYVLMSYVCRIHDMVSENDIIHRIRWAYSAKDGYIVKEPVPFIDEERLRLMVHPDDLDMVLEHYNPETVKKIVNEMDEKSIEFRIRAGINEKSTLYHWYRCTFLGMSRDEAHPGSLLIFEKDIHEEKCTAEEKKQMIQDALATAEHASNAKGTFMSRMSHEIRTPLNAIIGYINIAKNNINDLSKIQNCVGRSEIAAEHLLHIINDVLDMATIENGKLKISKQPFDIKQLVSELTEMYYNQAQAKNVSFDVSVERLSDEFLIGDEMRLNQILINILDNAVKFTPSGGNVHFSVIQVTTLNNNIYIRFIISDTGPGISPDFIQKIFSPFEQQDTNISQKFGGTGLGLSITKNLVTIMHGSINVESELGKGSTFIVEIPFDRDRSNKKSFARSEHLTFPDIRALIVSSDHSMCDYISVLLDKYKMRHNVAFSGPDAIRMSIASHESGNDYDMCLIDYTMPDMDGIETAQHLHEQLDNKTPIIVLASYDSAEMQEQTKSAGIDYFISKPLFQSTIFNLLVNIFDKYEPQKLTSKSTLNFSGKHLLLVEDNEMNMEIASNILTQAGFSVDSVTNGKEAVESFLSSPIGTYQAILMDIIMPVLDGYQATKQIRSSSHPEARTIPIIAMTANAFSEDVSASLSSGMNDHIAKPIILDQLFSTLSKYVNK